MNQKEILLNQDEIKYILDDARNNILGKYYGMRLLSKGNSYLTIVRITDKNGLILINGHRYTGYNHIKMRHNFWNENVFWRSEKEKTVLDNPTPFPKEIYPMLFSDIADEIYSIHNIVPVDSNSPFELYRGYCSIKKILLIHISYYCIKELK